MNNKDDKSYNEVIFFINKVLIKMVRIALESGLKHYRKSDDKLLKTDIEIIQTLIDEGGVIVKPSD